MEKYSKKIYWRAVITFYIIISFIVMGVSGIILFFSPPGRLAYWNDWRFLSLSKMQWQSIHTLFTFLFIIIASFHLYFNWSVILTYIKQKINTGMKRRNELIIASAIGILAAVLSICNYPPAKTIMLWGEELSESWGDDSLEPPVPHAELLNLDEFAEVINIDPEEFLLKIVDRGLKIPDKNSTIRELADVNHITPMDIYKIIQSKEKGTIHTGGSGYGKKTLEELCIELNINLKSAIKALSDSGIDAEPDERIKQIAIANNILPIDLVNLIRDNIK